MSKEINNRSYRQKVLADMIAQLHGGKSVDEVKSQFEEVFGGVSAQEIAQAEQALIENGLPVEEVQRLCDVHAAVFKGSIEEIHASTDLSLIPGHPVSVIKQENRAIESLAGRMRMLLNGLPATRGQIQDALKRLSAIDSHYLKKENLIFPFMETYGISGPPKVMWGVDDEIRSKLRACGELVQNEEDAHIPGAVDELLSKISEMIFKEENIMLPMLLESLTQDDWKRIADGEVEFGYCLIDPPPAYAPGANKKAMPVKREIPAGEIALPTGSLTTEELVRMLNTLPIDITFVDKEDTVRYFSQGAERVFPRTKTVIGRKVANCHPPASVHIVEKLVEDFRMGRKEHEDFFIHIGEKYILIRYFAVRSEQGEYLGVLEVTQNIGPIQEITGEKRLVSE